MKYYAMNSNPLREVSEAVGRRQRIEMRVARLVLRTAVKLGYNVGLHDGEDTVIKDCDKPNKVAKLLMSVDDETILFYKNGKRVGWCYLVYGNDGWDVAADDSGTVPDIMSVVNDYVDSHWG